MEGQRGAEDGSLVRNTVSGDAVLHGHLVQAQVIESLTIAAPPRPVPRQLPLAQGMFVNRTPEQRALTEALDSARVISVSGLGGVGKTQLVAHWAGAAGAERFPDGQLYADLADGRRDGAVDVSDVLADFLRALGVAKDLMPDTQRARSELFRSLTWGMRLLVVVDNAQHAPEVRPLLPGGGHLVALSRKRLPSLLLDGAVEITVDPLEHEAGVELVRHWRRTASEQAAAELVRLCGGFPLELRAAGYRLLQRPRATLEDVVRDLGGDGGRRRGGDDTRSAAAVFDQVVAGFPAHTRTLYRILGCLPGTTFTAPAATAAGAEGFEEALDDLLDAHLALAHGPVAEQRFRLHDVVRAHARADAAAHTAEEWRTGVLRALVGFYVERAAHADRRALGARFRLQPEPPAADSPFTDGRQALDWLDAERSNLLAVLRAAMDRGNTTDHFWYDAVWRLCESLWPLYHDRKHYPDLVESHRLGITAAQWEARPDAEVRLRNQLARGHYYLGDFEQAGAELDRAEELFTLVTDDRLRGVVWETRGLLWLALGEPDAAVGLFTRALGANAGDAHGVVVQSYNVAQAQVAAGRARAAVDLLEPVLAGLAPDNAMQTGVNLVLGRAHQALGDHDRAITHAVEAAARAHARGRYAKLAEALTLTAELADHVRDSQLRQACLDKTAQLRRAAGLPEPGGEQGTV
ncbi:hypothetical protein OK074_2186 [Actinobacteria bacterium OK074]|nr:hypothetical protein OK074_2186 [Actinobacteria bacterium OK074]